MPAGPLRHSHTLPALVRFRRWFAARERRWIALWLAGWSGLFAFLALWGLGANGLERLVERWNERWALRLQRGEELVNAGRLEEAASYLERLDAAHPAVFAKHGRDRERERVLALLAECHVELGNKSLALAALQRLVAFDPRNFRSHHLLAQGARDLDEPELALAEYEAALAILPSYLPALEGLVGLHLAGSRYPEVVGAFERYLDAWLLARVELVCGERRVSFELPVDGRAHAVEAAIELPAGWQGEVCLKTGGYSWRLAGLSFQPALLSGSPERSAAVPVEAEGWLPWAARAADAGAISAQGKASSACREAVALPHGAARVRVELALFKALPESLWNSAQRSYRNTLREDRLEAARARSLVGGCLEAGSLFVD